ncbi:MAG: hypothetical protein ACR2H1_02725 [Limisphaerales bacterium]
MNDSENKIVSEKIAIENPPVLGARYSSFWAVCAVFLTLGVVQSFYLKGVLDQRQQIQMADEQVKKLLPQAQTINQTVEKLGYELVALANAKSVEANKIISEFKIHLNPPPSPVIPPPPAK